MPHVQYAPRPMPVPVVGFDCVTLRAAMDALGPQPRDALACFIDLGLSDSEIAHYVGTAPDVIAYLQDIWGPGNAAGRNWASPVLRP